MQWSKRIPRKGTDQKKKDIQRVAWWCASQLSQLKKFLSSFWTVQWSKKGPTKTHWSSWKIYLVRCTVMWQEVITTYELLIKLLDSTIKQKNTTKRHWSPRKRFLECSMETSHQFIATWVLFIKLLDSRMNQRILRPGTDYQEKYFRGGALWRRKNLQQLERRLSSSWTVQ